MALMHFSVFNVCLQAVQSFDLSVLQGEQLELRVSAKDRNRHCHAVWLDPMLLVCETANAHCSNAVDVLSDYEGASFPCTYSLLATLSMQVQRPVLIAIGVLVMVQVVSW